MRKHARVHTRMHVCMRARVSTRAFVIPEDDALVNATAGHNYIGHNYLGHDYLGHDYLGQNY